MYTLQVNRSGYHWVFRSGSGHQGNIKKRNYSRNNIISEDYIKNSIRKTKIIIKKIVHNQDFGRSSFLTLTFRDESFRDYNLALYEFTKFIQRLNYFVYNCKEKKIKYLAVPEKQKRGVWHFHIILFSVPFLSNEVLSNLWGLGFEKVNEVRDINHLVNYISKYINKQLFENFGKYKKKILTSKGLEKGITISSSHQGANYDNVYDCYMQSLYSSDDFRLLFSKKVQLQSSNIVIGLFEVYFSKQFYDEMKNEFMNWISSMGRLLKNDIERSCDDNTK